MFGYDLGVDIGTGSVVISVVGKGIVLNEPSYVAYDTESEKILYAGKRAYYLEGREPNGVTVIQPIRNGVVTNYSLACQMLRFFFNRVLKKNIFRPRVVASVPSVSTDVDRRILVSVLINSGARSVCLIEEPLCSAFGSGIDPLDPSGTFVIDIGAGTSDMAVVSQGSMSQIETVNIAGDAFDEAIAEYLKKKYGLLIGIRTAENIKINIGGAIPRENEVTMEAKGRNEKTGLPQSVEVSSTEISECLQPLLVKITSKAKALFERTSPQLVADITDSGVILTGGSAKLYGMDVLLSAVLSVDVTIPAHPEYCVSKGCEQALKKMGILDRYGYTFKTKEEVRTR